MRRDLLTFLALTVVTFLVYAPALRYEFVSYDDPLLVTQNPRVLKGLTSDGVRWAFVSTDVINWQPVAWLSHMLDVELFGLDPAGHHFTSILLHAVNVGLLFAVLRSTTGSFWRSAFAAALYGWHPLRVESVAWVAERRDVLSGTFLLACLAAHASYARRPRPVPYLAAIAAGALALMSKPTTVTLPFLLLLFDVWPLRRLVAPGAAPAGGSDGPHGHLGTQRPVWRLMVEKIPFFALAVGVSALTVVAQQHAGAVGSVDRFPLGLRISNAVAAYGWYVLAAFWPADLAVLYPHPGAYAGGAVDPRLFAAGATLLAAGTLAAVLAWPGRPYLGVGWFWFVGSLVPMVGIVQVGVQAMADRYTYIPGIGLSVLIVWGAADVLSAVGRPGRVAAGAGITAALLACLVVTRAQLAHWRDSTTLFRRAIDVTGPNHVARYNLGTALADHGRWADAIPHLKEAVRIKPDYPQARNNLGLALLRTGDPSAAEQQFRGVLARDPGDATALLNLGNLLSLQGRHEDALRHLASAVAAAPESADARFTYALALGSAGRLDAAAAEFREVLRLRPTDATAATSLGQALALARRPAEAVEPFRRALELDPDRVAALTGLARVLATAPDTGVRNGPEAVRLAERAVKVSGGDDAQALVALAAAFAEVGRFDEAVRAAEAADDVARRTGDRVTAALAKRWLPVFQRGETVVDVPPAPSATSPTSRPAASAGRAAGS